AADDVQEALAEVTAAAGLKFTESELLNDGGNYVDDYAGMVVVSRKFLRDNRLTEDEGKAQIRGATGARHIAFIEADEQGGLEHADGVVAFIEPGVLVINSYPEDPDYEAALIADLERGLPGVRIHQITTPYDGSQIYDERFGSACGLYTNMLVTTRNIYLPQFGIPEDADALSAVGGWTDKEVVPVRSDTVCQMGGGVRCMSWQLRGQNADRLRAWVARSRPPASQAEKK
ncbi:MAG: agmatine deiminase family protein, partial [Pseudomonadota bacterium]